MQIFSSASDTSVRPPGGGPNGRIFDRRGAWTVWRRSQTAQLALVVSLVMYLAYGFGHDAWHNMALIGMAIFIAGFMPTYAQLSNDLTDWANNLFGSVTFGRLARFGGQFAFNLAAMSVLAYGGGLRPEGLATVGGVAGAAAVTTLASQGAQYFGFFLFQRRIGDWYRNILIGLCATMVLTGLGTAGMPVLRELFLITGIGFGVVIFGIGVLSDLRAVLHPKGGVGLFLGTFNPFHTSHLRLVRDALADRELEKVIIHPTVVPWLHQRALKRGEMEIAGFEDGYQVYRLTERADPHANYFPTGDRFLLPETRHRLIEMAIAEAGLADRVEVAYMPELYEREGFFGVIRELRRAHPGRPLHGLHGSDFGGMHARLIMDECGWIYPMPFLRRDEVSATAIRNGADGMTANAVAAALHDMRRGRLAPDLSRPPADEPGGGHDKAV